MGLPARFSRLALGALCLAFAGCTTLVAPAYDTALAEKTTSALAGLAQISARADLGALADPSSYAGSEPTYVQIVGDLAVAKVRADSAAASTQLSHAARGALSTVVGNCAAQVVDLAAEHKAAGLKPHSPFISRAMADCDLAVTAAKARG